VEIRLHAFLTLALLVEVSIPVSVDKEVSHCSLLDFMKELAVTFLRVRVMEK
jgi:hypothetical protein